MILFLDQILWRLAALGLLVDRPSLE